MSSNITASATYEGKGSALATLLLVVTLTFSRDKIQPITLFPTHPTFRLALFGFGKLCNLHSNQPWQILVYQQHNSNKRIQQI